MHNKGLNLLVFVLVMGPLIWFSQKMQWGDTGTFVCVVLGIALGFFILLSGKKVTRDVRRTFGNAQNNAGADFLFGPANPLTRQQEMLQMRQHVGDRMGQWNAPSLQALPPPPMMPNPARRPGAYDPEAGYYSQRTRVIPIEQPNVPTVPAYALPTRSTRPSNGVPPGARASQQNNGPRLELGPGARMHLQASLTGMLVVDNQQRRPNAPVFLEEWIRLGLGLLVVDTYGQYTGYLAQMSPSFGFLAGSAEGQEQLTDVQVSKYMMITSSKIATHVAQSVVDEGLQIIFNFSTYRDTTEAGVLLLDMLTAIERKAREFTTKPCAILFTDVRPFAPANEQECLIGDGDVAQNVYDVLMAMVEHAGQPGLKQLGVCLAVPSVEGIEEDVLTTTPLWVVNCAQEEEIKRINHYLELTAQETDQLVDGDTMLFPIHGDGQASFVRFRRAGLVLASRPIRSGERQTTKLPEEEIQGGAPGLRTEEQS